MHMYSVHNRDTIGNGNYQAMREWNDETPVRDLKILVFTQAVSNLIRDAKTVQIASQMQTGKNVGMQTLDDAIQDLLTKKWISPEEAYEKCIDKNRFAKFLKTPPDALQ
ncbi:MAG: hypothetical protein ACT4PN_16855 [Nitrospiraceae bacterium]